MLEIFLLLQFKRIKKMSNKKLTGKENKCKIKKKRKKVIRRAQLMKSFLIIQKYLL